MYKKESPGRLACFPPHFSHSLFPPRNASLQQCVGPIEEAEGMQRSFQRESVDQGSSAMKPEKCLELCATVRIQDSSDELEKLRRNIYKISN